MSNNISYYLGTDLSPEDAKKRISELRKLVLDNNKLKNFRTEDAYLLRFLHCTNFDVLLAFKRMEDFTDLIIEHPKWFATTSPLAKKPQIEINDKTMLTERDKQGRSILVVKLGKVDAIHSSPSEQSQICDIWLESIMDEPKTQIGGLSVIIDMQGYSWRLFKWLTPSNIKIATRKVDVYPFKEMLLHIVNTSTLLSATLKLIWPFLNEKLKKMFKFHYDNWASLHEYVRADCLPAEYGGTGPDLDFDKSNQLLFDKNTEIEAHLKYQQVCNL